MEFNQMMPSDSSGRLWRGTLGSVNADHTGGKLGDVRSELLTQEVSAGSLA